MEAVNKPRAAKEALTPLVPYMCCAKVKHTNTQRTHTQEAAISMSMGTPMADALNSAVAVHSLLGLVILAQGWMHEQTFKVVRLALKLLPGAPQAI
eukprot:1147571-Pelagomonas_calceolata.AAC.7